MKQAKLNSTPISTCPLCGEDLVGGGSPTEKWRRHRRREHYDWGPDDSTDTEVKTE